MLRASASADPKTATEAEQHQKDKKTTCKVVLLVQGTRRTAGTVSDSLIKSGKGAETMINLPSDNRIWLVVCVTDMRKSFNGLGKQVQQVLNDAPFSSPPVLIPRLP